MYWIYLILFILAVLVPDIIRGSFYFLDQERLEEFIIFLIGMAGFLIFVIKEHQLAVQQRESEKSQKRLYQTSKDLVDSYSYIGEVNRKMEMLMQIGLGMADHEELDKKKRKEIYYTILSAAESLMRSDCACIRFLDTQTGHDKLEAISKGECVPVESSKLLGMKAGVNVEKIGNRLVIASIKEINNVKSFLIIGGYSRQEEKNPNNHEILKYLATQALFLYSFSKK